LVARLTFIVTYSDAALSLRDGKNNETSSIERLKKDALEAKETMLNVATSLVGARVNRDEVVALKRHQFAMRNPFNRRAILNQLRTRVSSIQQSMRHFRQHQRG